MSRLLALILAAVALAGCVSPPPPYDYGPYLAHMPRSILVLPPLNESPEVDAPYSFLSTITAPLAERGYYVFPVAVVAEMMRQNGCPTPGEMHQAPLGKLGEVFGADAVLYLTMKQWGTSYQVINSATTVAVAANLVDVRTGLRIWSGSAIIVRNSSEGQRDIFGMLIVAVVNQIVSSATDPSHDLAPAVGYGLVNAPDHGMLVGPLSPAFAGDQRARLAARDAAARGAATRP